MGSRTIVRYTHPEESFIERRQKDQVKTLRIIPFLLLFLLLTGTVAFPAQTMVWGITPFPPGYITEGAEKGRGYADLLDRFMREKLTQYEHKVAIYPNWERQLKVMGEGPLVCTSILWYRPPHERSSLKGSYLLSAPNGVFFQHDVVVRKSRRHLFAEEVSFEKLLRNQNLTFGYNRPYGITYNRILADYLGIDPGVELDAMKPAHRIRFLRKAQNIHIRSGTNMVGGMLKMLLMGRVDYILEYDFMVRHEQKIIGFEDELVSIPVTEVKNRVSRIAYACSDTRQGQEAIEAINGILKQYRDTEEFKRTLVYLIPSGRKTLYWKEYEKILGVLR